MDGIISRKDAPRKPRRVLFLMGHPSRFWPDLGRALAREGHGVLKLDFCLADRLFWRPLPSRAYRGTLRDWPGWLAAFIRREGVTDVLYYADQHPYHRAARAVAEANGARPWAVEHGYLRPDFLTLEPGGMGAQSRFPKDWDEIGRLASGQATPDLVPRYLYPFRTEAAHEVLFHLVQAYGRPFYPRFVSDRLHWPAVDYLSWLPELALTRRREAAARRLTEAVRDRPYNLVAMQLEADYQIRASSPYRRIAEFLDAVMRSFALRAPASRRLVVKVHPLDNGLGRWFRVVPRIARRHDVERRVSVIRGGDLHALLAGSAGAVLVNSTVGLHALRLGVPVAALGSAVFDLPGLTHQGGIDTFWRAPEAPDPARFETFLRALTRIQVKGSFYNPGGREAAIDEICRRLSDPADPYD